MAALVLTACIRILMLGAVPITDATESRYAEIGREMLVTGNWVTPQIDPGLPFWGKPPLSTWVTAASLGAFGINAFAARLPHFLLGAVICYLIFGFACKERGASDGWLAATILATSAVFFVSAGAVMTDETLVLGTTLAMIYFWRAMTTPQPSIPDSYGFFIGLSIGLLAKGPLALVLSFAPIGAWAMLTGQMGEAWKRLPWMRGSLLTAVIALPWYALAEMRTPGFLDYFIVGEHWRRFTVPGWRGDLYGHVHSTPYGTIWAYALLGTLPWGLLAIRHLWRRRGELREDLRDSSTLYLLLWLLAPLVFFSFARNIIGTYVLPAIPAFALLTSRWIRDFTQRYPIRIAAIASLVPAIALIVLAVIPASRIDRVSQYAVVQRYFAERRIADGKLLYLDSVPYSAQFYAQKFSDAIDLEAAKTLTSLSGNYLAVREGDVTHVSGAARARLKVVGRYGDYLLLKDPPITPGAGR